MIYAVMFAILAYLVLVPLGFIVVSSLKPTGLPFEDGWTLSNFASVYGDTETYTLIFHTLLFVIGSTLFTLLIAIPLTWIIERSTIPYRKLLRVFVIAPMGLPPFLLALAWIQILDPSSGILAGISQGLFGNDWLAVNPYNYWGMIWVQGLTLVPSTYMLLAPSFRQIDPSLEEAASTSGASGIRTVVRIVLPLMRPAILAASIYLFVAGLVFFDVAGPIGMPTRHFVIATKIYDLMTSPVSGLPLYADVAAIAAVFLGILLLLTWVYIHYTRQANEFVTVGGKGHRSRRVSLGRWKWVAVGGVAAYAFVSMILPLLVLLWTSLQPYRSRISLEAFGNITLANHLRVFSNKGLLQALTNTLIVSLLATVIVLALAILLSWLVVRKRPRGYALLDTLAMIPLGLPGVIIGSALIFLYLSVTVLPIYGSLAIIVIAFVTTFLPFASRMTNSSMFQLSRELEEAASVSGAPVRRTLRKITVPLIAPGVIGAGVWVFAHAARELSAALMLRSSDNGVLTTLLWDYWANGEVVAASTVGVWLCVLLIGLVVVWQWLEKEGEDS